MEDLSTRGHTMNPVPALIVGEPAARQRVAGLAPHAWPMLRRR